MKRLSLINLEAFPSVERLAAVSPQFDNCDGNSEYGCSRKCPKLQAAQVRDDSQMDNRSRSAGVNAPEGITQSLREIIMNKLTAGGIAVIFVFIFTATAYAQPTSLDAAGRLKTELEPKIAVEINQKRLPGFAIGVVKDGKLIYERGFGVARLGGTTSITPQSLFHMASVTKTFVATAIMQLAEAGKIDLDAPLVRYLPYFRLDDERYRAVTIRQMLSHTSGIPDTVNYNWDKPEYDAGALERFVRSLAGEKLVLAPGEKFAYSNSAYEVLGDVIAKVSGESFEDYVQHQILTPLGMKSSTLLLREASPQLLTSPHVMDGGKIVVSKIFPYNRAHAPSSTLYSSIEDMSLWAIANLNRGELNGHRILKRETIDAMWRPVTDAFNLKEGISWFTAEQQGHRLVLHSGGDVGFESLVMLAPDDGVAVVTMTNFASPDRNYLEDFTSGAMRIVLGLKEQVTKTAQTPAVTTAQLNPDEARKKTDEILAAYVTALGGREALEKITSRTAKGSFEVSGIAISGPVEMFAKAPNKRLIVLRMPGNEIFKDGFDGAVGWELNPDDGLTLKTGLDEGSAMRDGDFYQALKLRSQYPNLIFKGNAKISIGKDTAGKAVEHDAFVLEAPRAGSPRRFYFDSQTGLLLRTEEWNANGKMTEAVEYDDYRALDGVKVPFLTYQIEDVKFTIKFSEVKHNVPIDDAVFVKPIAAKP
jgi:CubicO group peptidase (beta-lactamase class C family)